MAGLAAAAAAQPPGRLPVGATIDATLKGGDVHMYEVELAAGARRVVASLWKVDDMATSKFMSRFYRHMLQRRLAPAAALAAAQREMAASARWRDPYFWSGFVIQGEWR